MRNRKKHLLFKTALFVPLVISLLVLVVFYPPEGVAVLVFFIVLFLCSYLLFSIFTPFGLSFGVCVSGLLLLRFYQIDNLVNTGLVLALFLAFAVYEKHG